VDLMQHGVYVEQDECCVINVQNLKLKITNAILQVTQSESFQVIRCKKYESFKN